MIFLVKITEDFDYLSKKSNFWVHYGRKLAQLYF